MSEIIALIVAIAIEVGVPPYFAVALALEENPSLNPLAVNVNTDDTCDRGVMQLNDAWFDGDWRTPEVNIRAGCTMIKELMEKPDITTYWAVAAAYNCGYTRFVSNRGPPLPSTYYADAVILRWQQLEPNGWLILVERR